MDVTSQPYGEVAGQPVSLFTLRGDGLSARVTNYGAALQALVVDGPDGPVDVVLGYDRLGDYITNPPYLGVTVGRFANRIARGRFSLGGREYALPQNNGDNHIHGGPGGFSHVVWQPGIAERDGRASLTLSYLSPDMEQGYPGNLDVTVTYTLDGRALAIDYEARCDADTILNLTNHSYFNLRGHASGDVSGHTLQLDADFYTPVDGNGISTGEILRVGGTELDFRSPRALGGVLTGGGPLIARNGGFDHNMVIGGRGLRRCALLTDGGLTMETLTTMPGVQLYTANSLSVTGKCGAAYGKWGGVCLETQFFPDAPNHAHFPSPVLRGGEAYRHTTVYRFI